MNHHRLNSAVGFLSQLISIPSFSRDEKETADTWENWLKCQEAPKVGRIANNVYSYSPNFNSDKPTLMLNSHLDTVRPASSYTIDPFTPTLKEGHLYGLGSNDAGASAVSLASVYLDLVNDSELPVNILLAITAEEEVTGINGMRLFLHHLNEIGKKPTMAIVGEPTGMQPAIAERGLLVLDCETHGKAGHAARNEGINAIYRAIEDIEILKNYREPMVSPVLGPLKISVTMINAGTLHNAVPDKCTYVADVRTTDSYSNTEVVEMLQKAVKWSSITPRSTHINASSIAKNHPLVESAVSLGMTPFISPTTSDMAVLGNIPSLKIGPGESSRSHSADEYIKISEINSALELYTALIQNLRKI